MANHNEIYLTPMLRKERLNTVLSDRKELAQKRKQIIIRENHKIYAVLDTNIIIDALECEVRGSLATQRMIMCKEIINLYRENLFILIINEFIFSEYEQKCKDFVSKGRVNTFDLNNLLALIKANSESNRVLIGKQRIARKLNDDHLFDGINADYLVTEDRKGVNKKSVKERQSCYKKIVDASEFLIVLRAKNNV